jgi:hypothetical protein
MSENDDSFEVETDAETSTWPCCPQCGRRRLAVCPVCETAGTDFARGFSPGPTSCPLNEPDAEGSTRRVRPLVLCPICDEPFRPEFLACCEWCGYRFGDGVERAAPAPEPWEKSDLNARVWIVAAATLLTVAGVLALFISIARQ